MTQTLTTDELRQIVDSHEKGYGMSVPINYGYLAARELLANREAQPVAYLKKSIIDSERFDSADPEIILHPNTPEGWHSEYQAVFTAPPAPAVPTFEEWLSTQENKPLGWVRDSMKESYDACRAAMLAQPVSQGYKLVPIEPTEDMIAAAMNCDDVEFNSDETFCVNFDNIYRAMLAAAPEGSNG